MCVCNFFGDLVLVYYEWEDVKLSVVRNFLYVSKWWFQCNGGQKPIASCEPQQITLFNPFKKLKIWFSCNNTAYVYKQYSQYMMMDCEWMNELHEEDYNMKHLGT